MLAVPAGIAGCKTIVMATPPRPDGSVTPEVLYCAKKAGVTHVLKAGGAQAVAAMAWGTKTCPKVMLSSSMELYQSGRQSLLSLKTSQLCYINTTISTCLIPLPRYPQL